MNVICPCFRSSSSNKDPNETELTSRSPYNSPSKDNNSLEALYKISRKMSAPSIKIHGLNIQGYGLALVDVTIDQDCAYWECHVNVSEGKNNASGNGGVIGNHEDEEDDFFNQGITMKFGVTTKKDRKFYHSLESNEDEGMVKNNACIFSPFCQFRTYANIHHVFFLLS